MIKLYTTDICTVCQETIKWLEKHGVDYEIVNLKEYEL